MCASIVGLPYQRPSRLSLNFSEYVQITFSPQIQVSQFRDHIGASYRNTAVVSNCCYNILQVWRTSRDPIKGDRCPSTRAPEIILRNATSSRVILEKLEMTSKDIHQITCSENISVISGGLLILF